MKFFNRKSPKTDITKFDFSEFELEMIKYVHPFTMTTPERIKTLINSVEYLVRNEIERDFVECGVWRGGSSMVMAKVLLKENNVRNLWLFDTFEGMSEPTELDVDPLGKKAKDRLQKEDKFSSNVWAYSTLEEVQNNLNKTKYPKENLKYVKGKVEDTLIDNIPEKIGLLRLDTDWYESTKIELETLYPKVVKNGIIIIDDYGHWQGCKKAVDEFIKENNLKVFLNRIDYTGRLIVKN